MIGMAIEKIKIEKNTVQETLIVPLYGRKICSERFPELYSDPSAGELCSKLDYDFSELERKKDSLAFEFGALEAAMRQLDLMWEIKDYLKEHPKASVVNLGCGLDQSAKLCDNGLCKRIAIDFPDVIELRKQLIPEEEREQTLAYDLKNHAWMDEIDGSNGVIFYAAGVFHYLKRYEVRALVLELSKRFPGARLVFDSVGKLGLSLMLSKTLKNMGIGEVNGHFYVNNPRTDLNWSTRIKVSAKDYMLGYYDMKHPKIRSAHRMLAWVGDKLLKMAILRMDFLS